MKHVPNLGLLSVNGTKVSDEGVREIAAIRSLTGLNLSDTPITDTALEYLKQLPNLTSLSIGTTSISDEGLRHLAVHSSLHTLQASQCDQITDAGLKHLSELTNLVTLELIYNSKFTDAGIAELAKLKKLLKLALSSSKVSDVGLQAISEQFPNLSYLSLYDAGVTDAGLEPLKKLNKLNTLRLNGTNINGKGLIHLKSLAHLEVLSLSRSSELSGDALIAISDLKNLSDLDLANTQVSDADLVILARLKKLDHLELQNTKVTAQGVAELQKALPNCKISHSSPSTSDDHDREVAEWVLSIGGSVSVLIGEDTVAVTTPDQLTDRSFTIIDVGLEANKEVTDNDLSRFNGLRHLAKLNLKRTNIRDVGVLRLNDLPSLSHFILGVTKITNDALTNLERFPMLRTLSLEHTQIDDRALEAIGRTRTLTGLYLIETRCTGAGLRHLQGLGGLSTLEIGSTTHRDDFGDSIVDQLAVFKQLNLLSINGSRLTDDGLKSLVRVSPEIHALTLGSSELTDEGMKHLKSLPHLSGLLALGCPGLTDASIEHLKELNAGAFMLNNTKITAKGIDGLHKARPRVQINWTGGTVFPETRSPVETETTEALKQE